MSDINIPDFIRELPELDLPFDGIHGWLMQTGKQQVVFMVATETVDVPDHTHSEQWETPVAGQVDVRMNGVTTPHTPGMSFFVPAGVSHGALVHKGYKAIIIFNEPDRYKAK